jgi:hypothetical protein
VFGESDLSVISWNICRSLSGKLTDPDFFSVISGYDLIFLSECWLNTDDDVEINANKCFIFQRKLTKGGGIVVYCKTSISTYISVVENIYDSIIWCKFRTEVDAKDIYIA